MSLENNNGMYMPVGPLNGNGGFAGDGSGSIFYLIILFLFAALAGGGWGGYGNGGSGTTVINSDLQRGFDQQAVMGGINGVNAGIAALAQSQCNGFANAEISANNRQMANMQQAFDLSQQLSNCCCENRLAVAGLNAQIANDGAATRANTDAKTQAIMDKLCQLEMDGMRRDYENRIAGMQNEIDALRTQVTNQGFVASQTAQTAAIKADNAAQTLALEQYLNPTPIPAYPVQRPCCNGNGYTFAS